MLPGKARSVAAAGARARRLGAQARRLGARALAAEAGRLLAASLEAEWEHGRFFLWLPACVGTGVLLFFAADREPVPWLAPLLAVLAGCAAYALRGHRPALVAFTGVAAVLAGLAAASLRSATVGAPVLGRARIAHLSGVVEEVDHRRVGSRFVLRVTDGGELDRGHVPSRVRLTTRRDEPLEAGSAVAVTARLLPPAGAALPGGYAYARDAYFAGIGAVGSALGRLRALPAPQLSAAQALHAAVDRSRNALARRVDTLLGGGDVGAIAAAMVTGKRDLLSDQGRQVIREAGIFHIITIAGVQMTLVAGLLYGLTRRALALVPALALRHPIKKWAALVGIAGAVVYDVFTGSRIGTQRALIMTVVMLGAVLIDRRGLSVRNLAIAALAVLLVEPEAVTGASFQLSFAAVAALVAVYEARSRRREREAAGNPNARRDRHGPAPGWFYWPARAALHTRELLVATLCATAATASFMAANFHELSPFVLIGNPLTLGMIEFFAVPGALLGCALYPLGLDGPVWHWVGFGIRLVLWVARLIAAAPAATVPLTAFAPWALPVLALAVLSAVTWRSGLLRLTAVPLALVGLVGAASGSRYDLVVAADGTAVAARSADGRLVVTGRASAFAAEQWLRADGDGRSAAGLHGRVAEAGRCDAAACIVPLPEGQVLSLVSDASAFAEDCARADVIVTSLRAPPSCAAPLIVDRRSLARTGALGLALRNGGWVSDPARGPDEDRPWSPAPPRERAPGFAPGDAGPEAAPPTGDDAAP